VRTIPKRDVLPRGDVKTWDSWCHGASQDQVEDGEVGGDTQVDCQKLGKPQLIVRACCAVRSTLDRAIDTWC